MIYAAVVGLFLLSIAFVCGFGTCWMMDRYRDYL